MKKIWDSKLVLDLIDKYPTTAVSSLVIKYGFTERQIRNKAVSLGLKKNNIKLIRTKKERMVAKKRDEQQIKLFKKFKD